MQDADWTGLLPKEETGALQFIQKFPEYDGRGIIVGILDTGVDPGAIGLQTTTTGEPKVIDIIDCTGSGDVAMGSAISANEDNTLMGLSGRTLRINPDWVNPSKTFRLGLKRAQELYPRGLKDRIAQNRKEQRTVEIQELENSIIREMSTVTNSDLTEDYKTRLAQLRSMDKEFDDPGPLFDCIVFHDGERWNAIVDTSESGDLSTVEPMVDYRLQRQYRRFSDFDCLNYCVNIYDDGNVLSIVVDSGAHGTHVAGIVAAHHPDQPACNGVAPGAQIVSLKIGDTRLGSMETGVGIIRALIEAIKRGCHIINMSFGEATAWDNYGEFIRLAEKLVYEHGIIFVASAGNNGPALSTVGCPGGTSTAIMGIGALFAKSSMSVAYSMAHDVDATNYSWSSMGPSIDGSLGVSIIAPGGAVTCVPNWTLNKKQLMNGTSMSSPNSCGCISLLLSAAKQNALTLNSTVIRRAVENSATKLPNVHILGQGHGLVNVPKAWELLQEISRQPLSDIPIHAKVLQSEVQRRGIYLRQPHETSVASTFKVELKPHFHDKITSDFKVQYEMRLKAVSSAPWIRAGEFVELIQDGKLISVRVDPTKLEAGVHVEFIRFYDVSAMGSGPMVTVPVTVIKAETLPDSVCNPLGTKCQWSLGQITLEPGKRFRKFIVPPAGCEYIDAIIRDVREVEAPSEILLDDDNICVDEGPDAVSSDRSALNLVFHALQIFRGTPYRDNERDINIALSAGSQRCVSFAVTSDWTLEITLAPYFSTAHVMDIEVTLNFGGLQTDTPMLCMSTGQRVSSPIRVFSRLGDNDISPTGKLDRWVSTICPSSSGTVQPLGERDVFPDMTRLYQLILEYSVEVDDACDVCPRWPGLQGVLYESDFHAQLFMFIDSMKRVVGTGDSWPSFSKLKKGKYTLRLQVRHSSAAALESLIDMPVLLERKIKDISLSFHMQQSDALIGNNKVSNKSLIRDQSISFHCREPSSDQLPKSIQAGDVLQGTYSIGKRSDHQLGAGGKPGAYPIKLAVTYKSKGKSSNGSNSNSTSESGENDLDKCIKEAKIKYLKSLVGDAAKFEPLCNQLLNEYPDDLTIKRTNLSHTLSCKDKANTSKARDSSIILEKINAVFAAVKVIVDSIDADNVARILGTLLPKNSEKSEARKTCENEKSALIEAYFAKANALLTVLTLREKDSAGTIRSIPFSQSSSVSKEPIVLTGTEDLSSWENKTLCDALEQSLQSLELWEDINAEKNSILLLARLRLKGMFGTALKKINDLLSECKTKEITKDILLEEQTRCLKDLGWQSLQKETFKWSAISKQGFPLF